MNLFDILQQEENAKSELWQKVKDDWKPAIMEEHYFTDEKRKIIAGKIEGTYIILGFFHFIHTRVNEFHADELLFDLNSFSKELTNIAVTNNWFPVKMSIITPYKLSSYPEINLNKLDISGKMFGYLTTYPNFNKRVFNLQVDEVILQRIQAEISLQRQKQEFLNPKDLSSDWICSLCDGDNDTGCLMSDLQQCPYGRGI